MTALRHDALALGSSIETTALGRLEAAYLSVEAEGRSIEFYAKPDAAANNRNPD